MGVSETVASLAAFPERGAGTNSERRAALWLSRELRSARRDARIETFWCRPNWALAHAWHAGLAAAGSLVAVASPKIGGAIIIVALVSILLDVLTGRSLGRRLTPERASQNVVSPAPPEAPERRLIITANYDAGRMGLVHRRFLRRPAALLRRLLAPLALGWMAWLMIACAWVLVVAALRNAGTTGTTIGAIQLVPTVGLVLGFALLGELGGSSFGPAAGDNASGTAVALALARALEVSPPARFGVDVVLQGAGDGAMTGLNRHLRARRAHPTSTIVLGIAACGGGAPRVWVSDGPLIPHRFTRRLVELARAAGASSHRARGCSPAFPAHRRRLPGVTLGCLDRDGLVPRSHTPEDLPGAVERAAADQLLQLALTWVDSLDAELARTARDRSAASPTAA